MPPAAPLNDRMPVHVVYGGAHLFKHDTVEKLGRIALSSLEAYAPDAASLASAVGLAGDPALHERIYERTKNKLLSEPVEDFRIDFEDGYGVRSDDEEDGHAAAAAAEFARAARSDTLPAFYGIRIKPLSEHTQTRALKTLEIFLRTLLELNEGKVPPRFAVTLPKVSSPDEPAVLARELTKIEGLEHLHRTFKIELMIETPSAIFDKDGNAALPKLVAAADGRCTSAHFGAYDYTAALGISAKHQGLRHPACEFARNMMLVTLAPLGIRLVDSVTDEIPAAPHRGTDLSAKQKEENRVVVHRGWQTHFDNVLYSMSNGFYQSWDLHPSQLVARFAAVNYFYLDGFVEHAARLKNYADNATKATLTGTSFDDAASARGIADFFIRGINCGALASDEVRAACGLSTEEMVQLFAASDFPQ